MTDEEKIRLIEIRQEIDALSAQIGPLVVRRAKLARKEDRLNNLLQAERWENEGGDG